MNVLRSLTAEAFARWGQEAQLDMLAEECSELAAARNRFKRGRATVAEFAEEVADVYITLEFARLTLGDDAVDSAIDRKLERLMRKLELNDPAAEAR